MNSSCSFRHTSSCAQLYIVGMCGMATTSAIRRRRVKRKVRQKTADMKVIADRTRDTGNHRGI